ncbi:MAG: hypothetical protein R3F19_31125 [Verrucomicrobiales bacterium]
MANTLSMYYNYYHNYYNDFRKRQMPEFHHPGVETVGTTICAFLNAGLRKAKGRELQDKEML